MRATCLSCTLFSLLLVPACSEEPTIEQPQSLADLAREFLDAQAAGDAERLRDLAYSVCPTTEELQSIFQSNRAARIVIARLRFKDIPYERAALLAKMGQTLFRPHRRDQTEVLTHAASTEAAAEYERGSEVAREFPYGMQRFAIVVAAPERVWHILEIVEPGQEVGAEYACFTEIGGRFVFVPEPWNRMPG